MGETVIVCAKYEDFDISIMRDYCGQVPDPPYYGCYGNPFKLKTKAESVAAFEKYFLDRISKDVVFLEAVRRLKGKRLGCSCDGPPCHGYIYKEFLDKTDGTTQ